MLRLTAILLAAVGSAAFQRLAGYAPALDVVQYSKIDLDMLQIIDLLELRSKSDWAAAYKIYTSGTNSVYNDGGSRTLAGFSTKATSRLRECDKCPYWLFLDYANWYGVDDYGHQFVSAALGSAGNGFESRKIGFPKHDQDFTGATRRQRYEYAEKGIQHLNVWMYAYRMFEAAVDQCKPDCIACNDPAVNSWDGGVAFYVGSLEGAAGDSEDGVMPHHQADKRCRNFLTCGHEGGKREGTAMVNHKSFRLLAAGQSQLLMGNCDDTRALIPEIMAQMTIPLIQGALRYAQIGSRGPDPEIPDPDGAAAEGTMFSAAVVPRIAACPDGEADAEFIYDAMKAGAPRPYNFPAIKAAFERHYQCLKITCEEVGGFWSESKKAYYEGAEPCENAAPPLTPLEMYLIIGAAALLFLCISASCFANHLVRREKAGRPVFYQLSQPSAAAKSTTSTGEP